MAALAGCARSDSGRVVCVSEIIGAQEPGTRERVLEELGEGRLVVLPTDSVYGVVADAFRQTATRRLLRARASGRNRPLTVLIRSERQVVGLAGDVPDAADRLIAAYWPGPLTLILRASPGMTWDLGNTADTVALRIPTDDELLEVIKEVGPLACGSANRRNRDRPTTVEEAHEQLEDSVACYVDGGKRDGEVSTIVDASREGRIEVLRVGAIPAEDIERVAAGELAWGERPDGAVTVGASEGGGTEAAGETEAGGGAEAEEQTADGGETEVDGETEADEEAQR